MKAHLTKVSLALLSTVFLLGCQEQGSEPVGPEGMGPQLDHKAKHKPGGGGGGSDDETGKPNPGSQFYEYTFTRGDIRTNPDPAGATSGVVFQGCCDENREYLILSGAIADLFQDRCFDPVGGVIQFAEFIGDLRTDKQNKNKVRAVFLVKGLNGSGTADILYRLVLDGGSDENATTDNDDIFPPELVETTTVTFINASMEAQSKSERNKNACTADDLTGLDIAIEVTGRDTELVDTPT